MKKIASIILSITILMSIAACACAENNVSKTLTSTSTYVNSMVAPYYVVKSEGATSWNAPFYGASDSQRVVVRIYKYQSSGVVVSSTWVYSGYSTTSHPYKTGYTSDSYSAFLGAKVDDRDVGPITIFGKFNAN